MRTSSLSAVSRLATVGAVLLVAVAAVTTSDTSTATGVGPRSWWVATSGTTDGSGSSCADPDVVGTTHAAIQNALNSTANGDTVHLCEGVYSIGSMISVTTDVTITGDGVASTILDGGSTTQIMKIDWQVSDTTGATVDNLQFRNGSAGGDGGAIEVHREAKLTVTNSLFRNNRAAGSGGAIAIIPTSPGSDPGSLHIVSSTFYENVAGRDGGAVSTRGMFSPDPTITNSTFVGNTTDGNGGAVNSENGVTRVSHSTFFDNRAIDHGHATYKTLVSNSLYASSKSPTVGLCVADSPSTQLAANVTTDTSCAGSGGLVRTLAQLDLSFLAPWGGDTPTVAIGANSAAIGAIAANCASTDQRGVTRGAAPCDAGAFEYVPSAAALTPNRLALPFVPGQSIENYTLPVASGLTSPTYRLATEVSAPLTGGVTWSSADGRLGGAPNAHPAARHLVITASDGTGAVASVLIDTCSLEVDQTGVHLIASRADLEVFEAMTCGLDTHYRVTTDIAWNASWTPVGPYGSPFTGTFDGGGQTISGLDITGGSYTAFVSYAKRATLSALTLSGSVLGDYGSALLVGFSHGVNVVDVHGSGTVTGVSGFHECIGGLAGDFLFGSAMADSSFTGTVDDPDGNLVGGLVGCVLWPATVTRSSFAGSVTGREWVGGLVGYIEDGDHEDSQIVDSFAVGDVTAVVGMAGGLVGSQVSSSDPLTDPVAVLRSYASVALDSGGVAGGLIGEGYSTALAASFWESGLATAGALTAIGAASDLGNASAGSAATDPEDLRSYGFLDAAGWAVVDGWVDPATTSDVWGVCELMGLPFHLHRHTTNPCVVAPEPPAEPSVPLLPAALVDMTGQPAQSAGPSTTVPPTTVPSAPASPTTTVPPTVPVSVPDPVLSAGESAVFVDGQPVDSATTWGVDGSLTVAIGDTQVGLGFEQRSATSDRLGRLRQGRPVRLRLTGLRPGSVVTATLFSTPMPLGSVTADQSGVVDASLTVPGDAPAGRHRLRLEVLDREGRSIEVWAGVEVDPGSVQLPATGRSAPVVPALLLLLAGAITLGGTRRRRPVIPG